MKGDYTSAATFPKKMFHNPIVQNGKIVPYHTTITPTNVCNENCPECFCYERDKDKVMDISKYKNIVDMLYEEGTRAISLSGGGEPDCHPDINEIISYTHKKGIDVALVTNSKNLGVVTDDNLNKLTWIRVSGTSSRRVNLGKLEEHIIRGNEADWGLSYVVDVDREKLMWNDIEERKKFQTNCKYIEDMVNFSNKHDLTHVRIVSNMMKPEKNSIRPLQTYFFDTKLDMNKVVWNERTSNEKGREDCKMYLLHPVVDTDGNIQPCCGIHFATTPPIYDFNEKTSICNWKEYPKLLEEQKVYNGGKCDICQYGDYLRALDMLQTKPKHERFI